MYPVDQIRVVLLLRFRFIGRPLDCVHRLKLYDLDLEHISFSLFAYVSIFHQVHVGKRGLEQALDAKISIDLYNLTKRAALKTQIFYAQTV